MKYGNGVRNIALALLVTIAAAAPAVAAEKLFHLSLRDNQENGGTGIVKKIFQRPSAATYYSSEQDKLLEAPAGTPRFETYPGHRDGTVKAMLIETRTENILPDSSFETDNASFWKMEGLSEQEGGIHGRRALRVAAEKAVLKNVEPLTITPLDGRVSSPVFTAYLSMPDGTSPEGRVRPVAWEVQGDQVTAVDIFPKQAYYKNIKTDFIRVGNGRWWRMTARMQEKRSGGRYHVGLEFLKGTGMLVDALQLERNYEPWTASSYIPTAAGPAVRRADLLTVKTVAADIPAGSLSLWFRATNPAGRIGYILTHYAAAGSKENCISITGQNVQLGLKGMPYLETLWNKPEKNGDWRFVCLTWDGKQAVTYIDGREFAKAEGPWAYTGLDKWLGSMTVGNNGSETYNGVQGVLCDITLWKSPLTEAEVRSLYTGETQAEKADGASAGGTGLPVDFNTDKAGKVSLAVYDTSGCLVRNLVTGENYTAGKHKIYWDGRDNDGRPVKPGQYSFKGVAGNVKAEWIVSTGNSGNPPWGDTKVRAGLWTSVAAVNNGIVAGNFSGEGNRIVQRYDDKGNVLWTCGIPPLYNRNAVLTADGNYVYVVIMPGAEKAASGAPIIYEMLWRLDVKTGKPVPWSDGKELMRLTPNRTGDPERGRMIYDTGDVPWVDWGLYDIEVSHGKLYLPLHKENCIAVLDSGSGRELERIALPGAPRCLAVTGNGDIYVSLTDRVIRIAGKERKQTVFTGGLDYAWETEIGADGSVYISELGKSRTVKKYSPGGRLQMTLGKNSRDPFDFNYRDNGDGFLLPLGLCLTADGDICVADYGHSRIARYNRSGVEVQGIEAFGLGGMDGGVVFHAGEDGKLSLYTLVQIYNLGGNLITRYDIDHKAGSWKTGARWATIGPVLTQDPIKVKTMSNGKTYLFVMGRYPSIYRLENNGITFCSVMMHTQRYGRSQREGLKSDKYGTRHMGYPRQFFASDSITKDFAALGLLESTVLGPSHRFVWTDRNSDGRAQAGEIVSTPEEKALFYTFNDACVAGNGDIYMLDYGAGFDQQVLWRFAFKGFDDKDNPVYDWKSKERVWSFKDHIADMPNGGKECVICAKRVDEQGNIYLSALVGNSCFPTHVSLLSYDKEGRLRWKFGSKARGYKDRPGEFTSVTSFAGIADGFVYALDYDGFVDVLTTDGLYVATLLESGSSGGENSPYSNWGENFKGDVFKDSADGRHYLTINTHNYTLPVFRVDGIGEVKRFEGALQLKAADIAVAESRPDKNAAAPVKRDVRREGVISIVKKSPRIDGDPSDWESLPGMKADFDDGNEMYGAELKAAVDEKNLYILLRAADPTPAVNNCERAAALWDGDCLELYMSKDTAPAGNPAWSAGDLIIHLPARISGKGPAAGLLKMAGGKGAFVEPQGCKTVVSLFDNGK
ncbi:MAG: FlgD immunoglobulin-like domain containing protein, partial [bacterium]|nr:FlgD immunoglobulin-like domain containing protein [bacterium]